MNLCEVRKKVSKKQGFWIILYPLFLLLSKLYCGVATFRYELYRGGFLRQYFFPIPVISVGNIVAGGTGKTPLVEYIYTVLRDLGFSPAIVMRGYGGTEKGPVVAEENPDRYGDEAVLYVKKDFFTIISRNRVAGIDFAMEKGANVVILDDGFQQFKVKPTINIVVIDPFNPFGGDFCLPLGTLREPVNFLERADCFVISRANIASVEKINSLEIYLKNFGKPVFRGEQNFKYWINERFEKISQPDEDINLFCGIGAPVQFVKMIEELGYRIEKSFFFPDHYGYIREDIERLSKYRNLVTTEKDLVKVSRYQLPVKVPVLGVEVFGLKEFILNRIKNVEKHEEKDEQKVFIPDGISVSHSVERGSFRESQ